MALISVLDERHDPDAGVLHLMLGPTPIQGQRPGAYRFHLPAEDARADAGLRALHDSGTAAEQADRLVQQLRADGVAFARRAVKLDQGTAYQLDYDEDMGLSKLHHRSMYIPVPGGAILIDLGTFGLPSRTMAGEFFAIVTSLVVTSDASPSP